MVAGDAVNTAARVQSAAEPGSVLVDGPTRRLAGAIEFADTGEHALKGKAEPQRLWQATYVLSGGVGGMQRVDGLEAPLIGRDAELRTIRELFHAADERKVPRLVLISGPAGVGKSRLGWEFRKYIDGLAELMWWHRGRCLSYGEGVAFWALAEIVRQRLGIAEEDPADVAAGKLAAGLDRFVPDPDERAYVGARLGRLLGIAVSGDGGGSWRGKSCTPGGGCSSSGSRRCTRWCCWSRMPNTPIARCWTSSITWSTGCGTCRCRLALARPEWARPGRGSAPGAQPDHADPGPAQCGLDGPAGRCAGAGDTGGSAGESHCPGPGYPAVRGRDGARPSRPGHHPADRGCIPADRRRGSWLSRDSLHVLPASPIP